MAFQSGSNTYSISVARFEGGSARLSTGTRDKIQAHKIERAVEEIGPRGKQDRVLYSALIDQRVKLPEFYDYFVRRELDVLKAKIDDIDLIPLIAKWDQVHAVEELKTKDQYLGIYRLLFAPGPDGKFLRSQFTSKTVIDFLEQYKNHSTRNTYRAMISSFAEWLKAKQYIDANPIKEVKWYKQKPPHILHYTDEVMRAIIDRLPTPEHKALEAFMCSTSAEWSACERLHRNDIDDKKRVVQAHGTKTEHRDRPVVFTHRDEHGHDWTWDYFWAHAKTVLPTAPVFTLKRAAAMRAHKKAVRLAGAQKSTLHDWRHAFAVRLRRMGEPDFKIAKLMGHKDATEVIRVYGRFDPTETELQVLPRKAANG